MSPNELQQAVQAAKSMVARGEIKTLPSVPCGTTVYHAVGAKTDRGLYKKRPTGKVTQAEYDQLCAQGLTVQGTPRKRRPYELRQDLSTLTKEARRERLRIQKRRYAQRRKESASYQSRPMSMRKFNVKFAKAVFCSGVDQWFLRLGPDSGIDVMFQQGSGDIARMHANMINASLNRQLNKRYRYRH